MKKQLGILLALICIFLTAVQTTVFAASETIKVSISVYEQINNTFKVKEQELQLPSSATLRTALRALKKQEIITAYKTDKQLLSSLTFHDNTKLQQFSFGKQSGFVCLINGVQNWNALPKTTLKNNDRVIWVFTLDTAHPAPIIQNDDPAPNTGAIKNTEWNKEQSAALKLACDWIISQKDDLENDDLLSLGIAGASAPSQKISLFLDQIRKAPKPDPSTQQTYKLIREIITAVFCGYDPQNIYGVNLINRLATYPNLCSLDTAVLSFTLLTYDSADFTVNPKAINNRDNLLRSLLARQHQDGGFAAAQGKRSSIESTALAVTALSAYPSRPDVEEALHRAVTFLAEKDQIAALFGKGNDSTSKKLALTITALQSVQVPLSDQRFVFREKSLADALLEYQNADGGFGSIRAFISDHESTQIAIIALTAMKKTASPYIASPDSISGLTQNVILPTSPPVPPIILQDSLQFCLGIGMIILFCGVVTVYYLKDRPKK